MQTKLSRMVPLVAVLFLVGFASRGATMNSVVRNDGVVEAMTEALQDEYHSQQTYQAVLEDFGNVLPFANIVEAEGRHIEKLSQLFSARDLEIPASKWTAANVARFGSVEAACTAGIGYELENVAMYDRLLKQELPADVAQAFQYLRAASEENHLAAFRRCAGRR